MQESYGEKIRNIISPCKILIDKMLKDATINEEEFDIYNKSYERLLNFSYHEVMEHNFVKDGEII